MTTDANVRTYELSLEETPERPRWRIDGTDYNLADPDDYPVPVIRAINRMWAQLQAWDRAEEMKHDEGVEYEKHLNALVKYCLPELPDSVYDSKNFDRTKKSAVVLSFFLEGQNKMINTMREIVAPLAEPSPDSNDSTEDELETGLISREEILSAFSN